MPTSIAGRNASDYTQNKSPEMTTIASSKSAGPSVSSVDDSTAAPVELKKKKAPINKQTWDYAIRSLAAGGLAGCSVGGQMRSQEKKIG